MSASQGFIAGEDRLSDTLRALPPFETPETLPRWLRDTAAAIEAERRAGQEACLFEPPASLHAAVMREAQALERAQAPRRAALWNRLGGVGGDMSAESIAENITRALGAPVAEETRSWLRQQVLRHAASQPVAPAAPRPLFPRWRGPRLALGMAFSLALLAGIALHRYGFFVPASDAPVASITPVTSPMALAKAPGLADEAPAPRARGDLLADAPAALTAETFTATEPAVTESVLPPPAAPAPVFPAAPVPATDEPRLRIEDAPPKALAKRSPSGETATPPIPAQIASISGQADRLRARSPTAREPDTLADAPAAIMPRAISPPAAPVPAAAEPRIEDAPPVAQAKPQALAHSASEEETAPPTSARIAASGQADRPQPRPPTARGSDRPADAPAAIIRSPMKESAIPPPAASSAPPQENEQAAAAMERSTAAAMRRSKREEMGWSERAELRRNEREERAAEPEMAYTYPLGGPQWQQLASRMGTETETKPVATDKDRPHKVWRLAANDPTAAEVQSLAALLRAALSADARLTVVADPDVPPGFARLTPTNQR